MAILELELAVEPGAGEQRIELPVPAGTQIVDAEPRYGPPGAAVGVHLLAAVDADATGEELFRFRLLSRDEVIPRGWGHLLTFDGRQLVLLNESSETSDEAELCLPADELQDSSAPAPR